jgi:hypothetical protein
MSRFILPTVAVLPEGPACAACRHPLGTPWKAGTRRRDVPLAALGGPWDTGTPGVLLRQFLCPGCGALLDTETATATDAPLDDRLGP